jgi:hypothetical protein
MSSGETRPLRPHCCHRTLSIGGIGNDFPRHSSKYARKRSPPNRNEAAYRLLEEPLDGADKASVPAVVNNVLVETTFTPLAAERLKVMLSKLGKSAYDIAIKIIGDIGSATAKKMLGL